MCYGGLQKECGKCILYVPQPRPGSDDVLQGQQHVFARYSQVVQHLGTLLWEPIFCFNRLRPCFLVPTLAMNECLPSKPKAKRNMPYFGSMITPADGVIGSPLVFGHRDECGTRIATYLRR